VHDVAPAELQRLEGSTGRTTMGYVIWQIARICLINGKTYRASQVQLRSRVAGRCVGSGFFYLLLPFNVVIMAKRKSGSEKLRPLSFSSFSSFFFSYIFFSFAAFIFVRFGRNIWCVDKRMICEYANTQSRVFSFSTNRQ